MEIIGITLEVLCILTVMILTVSMVASAAFADKVLTPSSNQPASSNVTSPISSPVILYILKSDLKKAIHALIYDGNITAALDALYHANSTLYIPPGPFAHTK
jgi:hypothetical protein